MVAKITPVRVSPVVASDARPTVSLGGEWAFQLDPGARGGEEAWHRPAKQLSDTINVPGCLEAQGKGLEYLPLAQPEWAGTCDKPYLGASWYQRRFEVPPQMRGKALQLRFGGVMTDCEVWLNGQRLGAHRQASVPFGFDITEAVRGKGENVLTVRVENRQTY